MIVLENGREVDRVVGSLQHTELKRRLTGDASAVNAISDAPRRESGNAGNRVANSNFGPNHPMYKSNLGPNHPQYKSNVTSRNDLSQSIGINHPYYSHYKKTRIASSPEHVKPQPNRPPRIPPPGFELPDSPGNLAATVRIRVKYQENDAVGTGTIIDTDGDESLVLTCGHLFRNSDGNPSISIELFSDGETIQVPATLFDYRNDEVDLGLVKFRRPGMVSRVSILPKGELPQEDEFVFSIGCDGGEAPSRRDTYITKLNRFLGPSNVEIAGVPAQGRSGGGLFDARERLIGVCIAADNELDEGLFVGPEAIYAQLAKHNLNRLFE